MANKIPKSELPDKTDEEIRDLAMGILRNEIFTDCHIAPDDAHLFKIVFSVFSFMDRKALLDLQRKVRPALVYAPMSSAGPRAVNGYPIFFEAQMLHEADSKKLWAEYKRLSAAMESAKVQA